VNIDSRGQNQIIIATYLAQMETFIRISNMCLTQLEELKHFFLAL